VSEGLRVSPPHVIGPTWARTLDGHWFLPERTLGWEILNWLYQYVRTPGGDFAGEGFVPTDEQSRFLLWWYAVDENGKYTYREGMLRRLKGWGKDPFAAALALVELCGPVAFSHFDSSGNPVGKRRHGAWVQIAAVSQDQTKNTFRLFPIMISQQLKRDYNLDVNKFVIYAGDGGVIEAVTSSPASMEGNRPTFVIKNEIQWWGRGPGGEANDGHEMDAVITGNLGKTANARALSIFNAHVPGTESVAEKAWDNYQDVVGGKVVDTGILYDALEAPADTPVSEIPSKAEDPEGHEKGVERLRQGVLVARGDSYWLPVDTIVQLILDTRNPITESRRKFLNQINAAEDSWISPQEWNLCAVTDDSHRLKPGDKITLGFDGSKSSDHSGLIACRVSDGMLFVLGHWKPADFPTGEIDRSQVDAVVRSAKERYEVVGFRADVKEFEAYVDQWGEFFKNTLKVNASPGNPVAFDMRGNQKKFAMDCERFRDAVLEGTLQHDANASLKQHVTNAKMFPTTYDAIAIRKATKDSSRKIDLAVCGVLAYGSRQDFLMSKDNRDDGVVIIY
jgi:phage terminase large subunit-like protein